ncbi:MAG TPA: 50S ribosomal protein L25 [Candidatus Acetothermia bacterium]|nr:50S ribosomal protein L25 [Candidatus Acetothermia bacterium]
MKIVARIRSPKEKPRALRRQGLVPGVVYGPHIQSTPIAVEYKTLERLVAQITRSTRLELEYDGEKHFVFIKELQRDPITDRFLHVDFYAPEPGQIMSLDIPIRLVGTPEGVKAGGLLEHIHEEIPVEGPLEAIPPYLEVDISQLGLDEALLVKDLSLPEGLRVLLPEDEAIVTILPPKVVVTEEEAAEEVAEETAEGAAPAEGEEEEGTS